MTKSAARMLRLMDRAVTMWHIPVIGKEKGRVLRRLLAKHRCRRGIEVGSLFGYSAILVAGNMPRNGRLTCIENNAYLAKFVASNAEKAGLKRNISVVVSDAKKEDYLDYLRAIEPRLVKGALVVADNTGIYRREVNVYLAHVRAGGRYDSREYDFGFDCMEVSIF